MFYPLQGTTGNPKISVLLAWGLAAKIDEEFSYKLKENIYTIT